MRITEICTYDPRSFGGLETVVSALSERFSDEHDVDILYRGDGDVEATDIGTLRPLTNLPHLAGHIMYNLLIVRAITETDADIVHGHGQNGLGMALRRRFRGDDTPFVMTYHGTYAGLETVRNASRTVPIWNPLTKFEQWAGKNADTCVACSEQVKQELVEHYGVAEDAITVIHNGVDTDLFHPIPEVDAKDVLDLDPATQYLCWLGGDKQRKGFDRAQEIVQELSDDYKLLVAGHDGEDTENVTYLGYVPDEHLPHFYNAADAFLFPTQYEGHPLAVLEAFATHTPVITTAAANVEIAEKDEHYLLLEEHDVGGILRFLDTAADADFSFIEEYDWEHVADRYLDVFEEVRNH